MLWFSLALLLTSASPPANISLILPGPAGALLTIHQVQNEAELVRGVEGVGHADYERTVLEGKRQRVHLRQQAKCNLEKPKIRVIFFL